MPLSLSWERHTVDFLHFVLLSELTEAAGRARMAVLGFLLGVGMRRSGLCSLYFQERSDRLFP
jgi:hypothetical protein